MIGGRSHEREHRPRIVAGLFLHHAEVDAAAVDARRRAGLQAVDAQRQFAQAFGQGQRGWIAGPAAAIVGVADVDFASQKSAGGEDDAARAEIQAHLRAHAGDAVAVEQQVVDRLLEQGQLGLVLHRVADEGAVQRSIGLAARGAHGRTLARVEPSPLDARGIGGLRHDTAECVDLLDQVTLADAADGRVAAHRADRLDAVRQQQRARARARRGQRGLGAGMAAADDDDVEGLSEIHGHSLSPDARVKSSRTARPSGGRDRDRIPPVTKPPSSGESARR
jgi:hypothetical protein